MFGCGLVVYLVVIGWFVWLFAFAVHPRRSAPPPPAGDTVALLHDVLRQRGKPLLRSLRSSRLRPSTIPAGGWHENEVPSTIPRWRDGNKTKFLLLSPAGGWHENEVPSTIPRWRGWSRRRRDRGWTHLNTPTLPSLPAKKTFFPFFAFLHT